MAQSNSAQENDSGPSTEQAAMDMATQDVKDMAGCVKDGGSQEFCSKVYGGGHDMSKLGAGKGYGEK